MKYTVLLLFMVVGLSTQVCGQSESNWQAPPEADTLQNPYDLNDEEVFRQGEDFFLMLCASCHGERGDGGGGAGQAFDPPPADFTQDRVQNQSDGALFWKLSEGNPPGMLSYKDVLSEEERWQIVTYLRQFSDE